MNREINHKTQNKKVVVLFDANKKLIGYNLVTFTPKHKRVLTSYFTLDNKTAKEFLK